MNAQRSLRSLGILYHVQAFLAIIGIPLSVLLFIYVWVFYHGGFYAYKPYTDAGWNLFFTEVSLLGIPLLYFCCLPLIAVFSLLEGNRLRSRHRYGFCLFATVFQGVLVLILAVSLLLLLRDSGLSLVGFAGFLILLVFSFLEIVTFVLLLRSSVRAVFQQAEAHRLPAYNS